MKINIRSERATLAEAIQNAQRDATWIADGMPDVARNDAQILLQAQHGTPKAFALDVIKAIGEISILEAQQAAEKYKREWEAAK